MDWLWKNIFSSLVVELILVLGGAAVLGYVKRKLPEHATTLAYSLFGATCVAILIFTFTGRALFSDKPPDPVTPENLEQNVKAWAEHVGMNIGPAREPDSAFAYTLSNPNGPGDPVIVYRGKDKSSYLQFKALINVSAEHQAALSKMSQAEVNRIMEQLNLDIGRANIGCTFGELYVVNEQDHKTVLAGAVLQRGVAIANLNEASFIDSFDQITRGVSLVRAEVRLAVPDSAPKGTPTILKVQ
jgi:hypothetical protein